MRGKKTLGTLALAAGFVAWAAASAGRTLDQDAVAELPQPEPVVEPPAAAAPVAAPRRFRRRLATSLAFTMIFFAGAALAAGAGNELAHADAGSTDPAVVATDVTDATDTTATTTDATATTDAATTDATATTVDTTTDAATTTVAAVTTDDTTTATTTATATDVVTTDPSDATPAPAPADTTDAATPAAAPTATPAAVVATPVVAHTVVHAKKTAQHRVVATAPIVSPFPVVPFDPQAWLADNPGTPTGNAVVTIAEHFLGVPYRWGGNRPTTGFDCSGLTQYVYAQLGIWLPHYAAAQFLAYPRLEPSQLQPGDLVFFEPKADGPGHVAIYAGNGTIIEAPHTGAVVRVGSLAGAAASMGFLGAVRPSQIAPMVASPVVAAPGRAIDGRFIAE